MLLYAAKVGCQRTVPVQGNRPRSASFARNDPLNAPLDFGRPPRSQYDGDIPLIVNLAGRFHMKDGITDRFGQGEHRGPLLLGWGRGGAGHRCVPWFGAAVPRVCGHASHAGSRCHSAFLGASGSRAGRLRPWVRCTALVSNPGPVVSHRRHLQPAGARAPGTDDEQVHPDVRPGALGFGPGSQVEGSGDISGGVGDGGLLMPSAPSLWAVRTVGLRR